MSHPTQPKPPNDEPLIGLHLAAGFLYFGLALFVGLLVSLQYVRCYPFPGVSWLSPGRMGMALNVAVLYGFLANGFVGGLYWAIPQLTGRAVWNQPLGRVLFWGWQSVVAIALVMILGGWSRLTQAQAVRWGETPVATDPLVAATALLWAVQFIVPLLRKISAQRVSAQSTRAGLATAAEATFATVGPVAVAFCVVGLVWIPLAYVLGNIIPGLGLTAEREGLAAGFFRFGLAGTFLAPLGWGVMLALMAAHCAPVHTDGAASDPVASVPSTRRDRISAAYARCLTWVGFWGTVWLAPLAVPRDDFGNLVPVFSERVSRFATVGLQLCVLSVLAGLVLTKAARPSGSTDSPSRRWLWTGIAFAALAALERLIGVSPGPQQLLGLTDWNHALGQLVLLGVFGFWLTGLTLHLWPRLTSRSWHYPVLLGWHYWLSAAGVVILVMSLASAGLVQGAAQTELLPWTAGLEASTPFWWGTSVAWLVILAGQTLFGINLWCTARCWANAEPSGKSAESAARGPSDSSSIADASCPSRLRVSGTIAAGLASLVAAWVVHVVAGRPIEGAPARSIEQIANEQFEPAQPAAQAASGFLDFELLAQRFPEEFARHYPAGATPESLVKALRLGRDIYVREGCWNCHTQSIRPIPADTLRWGAASEAYDFNHRLHRPALVGTRRIGPDLARQAGRHSNDWHLAHFWNPTAVVGASVMPRFAWFFDQKEVNAQEYRRSADTRGADLGAEETVVIPVPNEQGIAITTYVQWLGRGAGTRH